MVFAKLALGINGLSGEESGPVEVEVAVADAGDAFVGLLREATGDVVVAKLLRSVESLLDSIRALSLVLRARDLVYSMRSFSRSRATGPLMYSEPLSP